MSLDFQPLSSSVMIPDNLTKEQIKERKLTGLYQKKDPMT